jgi:hypothetical protein
MKNSNDTIGNRTRDLPACSAVPQPTAPPRAPRLQADVQEIVVLFLAAVRGLFLFQNVRPFLEPISLQFNGSVSLGAGRSGCQAEHLSPSNVKVKSNWSYTCTPIMPP